MLGPREALLLVSEVPLYSQVDSLGSWYQLVKFGAEKSALSLSGSAGGSHHALSLETLLLQRLSLQRASSVCRGQRLSDGSEEGSSLRLTDACITQLQAREQYRREEEDGGHDRRSVRRWPRQTVRALARALARTSRAPVTRASFSSKLDHLGERI